MFRKKIAVTIAAALMTLSASSAFAAFTDLELIRVYYDRAGNEYATDLGKVKDLTAAGASTTIGGTYGSLAAGSSFAVYFAVDRATNELWASGSTSTPSVINGALSSMNSMKTGAGNVFNQYGVSATTYVGLASAINSYKNKLSATQGTLNNAITAGTRLNTEVTLAQVIGSSTGSATQTLYYWAKGITSVAAEKIGVAAATIVTNADGSATIISTTAAAPTPIPPAFLLMGSGLLGMVGLRRKNKAA